MKIVRLDSNKIKVVITESDLESLDMSIEKFNPNSAELHTFLFKIMERVEKETGFNPYNGQVLVEASPSSEGVVLIVTKIDKKMDKKSLREKYKKVRAVKKKDSVSTYIYSFEKFENLCIAIKNIPIEVMWNVILYEMNGLYYFVLSTRAKTDKVHNVLIEFCDECQYPNAYANVLDEQGKIIAKGEKLVNMAKKITELY